MKTIAALILSALLVSTATATAADAPVIKVKEKHGFLRGNTHVHTDGSGDSDTPVADAARWYEERGYDFIVVTDHNNVTVHKPTGKMQVFAGVEMTFNVFTTDAAPGQGGGACVHMNGYFIPPDKKGLANPEFPRERTRIAYYESELKAIADLGGVASVNHPNYTWACDAAMLARLAGKGLRFFEVFNSADKSMNDGEKGEDGRPDRPSTEQLWDTALSAGAVLYGIVSDDAHHYYDAEPLRKAGGFPRIGDLAWVMVRAKSNAEADIRAAMIKGDFYGSTGVTLKTLDATDAAMEIEIAAEAGVTYTIRFIGKEGKVLLEKEAAALRYEFKGDELYVRAMVIDSKGNKAWIQPTFLKKQAK